MVESKSTIIIATQGIVGTMLPSATIAQALSRRDYIVHLLVPRFCEALVESKRIEYSVPGTAAKYQSVLADPGLWNA